MAALGNQLIEIHQRLRLAMSDLSDISGNVLAKCLAFCGALERHHTGEERGVFRVLAAKHPELRPVIDELRRDHEQIAEILRRVAEKPTRDELAGLAALMESHFTYEERKLVEALNRLR
ncbi:MAG TPA: hemerythrin domain-containing protein [Dactylosporangium sp.]|nr:hemerythrin domain-containing protein [Dactylosporangium sp.]